MFEPGRDQASGLRRLFEGSPLPLLALGCASGDRSDRAGAHALADALQRAGRRALLIDLLGEIDGMDAHRDPDEHPDVHRLFGADARAQDLADLLATLRAPGRRQARPLDVVLVAADPLRLGDLAAGLTDAIVLLAPGELASLARVYAQIKALRLAHGMAHYVAAFRDAHSYESALASHRRLADAAARFLSAKVSFGGVVATGSIDRAGWDRLADVAGWGQSNHGERAPAAPRLSRRRS